MKRLMILALVAIGFSSSAQIATPLNTTITKGYGNFTVDGKKFPLNSVVVVVSNSDTALVTLVALNHNAQFPNDMVSLPKKRSKYINGTTGLAFPSIGALTAYCDSFMYSH
jgi:hypothetical protein